jgi:hypothetical protein
MVALSGYFAHVMTGDIKKLLARIPFAPFTIQMARGQGFPVPTIDHIYLPPAGGRVVVSDDEGYVVTLPALLISGLVEGPVQKARRKRGR